MTIAEQTYHRVLCCPERKVRLCHFGLVGIDHRRRRPRRERAVHDYDGIFPMRVLVAAVGRRLRTVENRPVWSEAR